MAPYADVPGVALVAVGGLGRREPAPYSDLDLVLLHEGKVPDLAELADSIWYPIWDSKVKLDHSVRTPDQAVTVAKDDLKALLGLLDVRHIAGDAGMTGRLRAAVLDVWRTTAVKRLPELNEISRARWEIAGEGAFLLEPNLKDSRGCLRDAQALHALALAQLVDFPVWVREAYPLLLDVRGELQRQTGGADDVLRQQEHDGVAAALGLLGNGIEGRDQLLRRVNEAARTIAHALDMAARRVRTTPAAGRPVVAHRRALDHARARRAGQGRRVAERRDRAGPRRRPVGRSRPGAAHGAGGRRARPAHRAVRARAAGE